MRAAHLLFAVVALCALALVRAQDVTTVPPAVALGPDDTSAGITQLTSSATNPVGLPDAAAGTLSPNVTASAAANTSTPASGPVLKKPIIWRGPKSARDPDAPLTGAVPKHLKKPHITPNIYGGDVEYRKGKNGFGCPCKLKLKERFRYDAELRDRTGKKASKKCKCGKKKDKKKPRIPPVIAALYPKKGGKGKKGAKKPCDKKAAKKKVEKIAPEYKPAVKKEKKKPCKKDGKKKKATIEPEFYPAKKGKKGQLEGVIVRKLKNRRRKDKKKL